MKRVTPLAHRTSVVTEQKGARMDSRTFNSIKIHFVELSRTPQNVRYGFAFNWTSVQRIFRSYKYFALRLEKPIESLVALHEKRMASTPPLPPNSYAIRGLDWHLPPPKSSARGRFPIRRINNFHRQVFLGFTFVTQPHLINDSPTEYTIWQYFPLMTSQFL